MILYFKNRIIKWGLILSLFLNLCQWLLCYWRIPIQVEPIVLRFNIYVGINLIGPWSSVFLLPLAGLIIILLNFIWAKFIFKKDKLPAELLSLGATLCQLVLLIEIFLLVMINF